LRESSRITEQSNDIERRRGGTGNNQPSRSSAWRLLFLQNEELRSATAVSGMLKAGNRAMMGFSSARRALFLQFRALFSFGRK
jgi:hypothetical protein